MAIDLKARKPVALQVLDGSGISRDERKTVTMSSRASSELGSPEKPLLDVLVRDRVTGIGLL